ncbi:MAG: tetratricopeptide repeat protein [candidate division Zixibacteria bacterium]
MTEKNLNTITIRELGSNKNGFKASVAFNHGPEHKFELKDPAEENQNERFEWYFEHHLQFPFTDTEIAKKIAKEIYIYGGNLFGQVFDHDHKANSELHDAIKSGLDNLAIEIVGDSPKFHAIHWEALKNPDLPNPFVAERTNIFRKNQDPSEIEAEVNESPFINLLIVTARPDEADDIGYRIISKPLVEMIETAKLKVNAHLLRPGTYSALTDHLAEVGSKHYHIIHFDMHGSLAAYEQLEKAWEEGRIIDEHDKGYRPVKKYNGKKAFVFFESDHKGKPDPVDTEEITKLLISKQIPVCMLDACQTAKQIGQPYHTSFAAGLMAAGMKSVVANSYSVTIDAARLFMENFYKSLLNNQKFTEAITWGRHHLYKDKRRKVYFGQTIELEDWLLPIVYQNRPVDFKLRPFTPEEEEEYYERKERRYKAKEPTYGFVGRDLDFLAIEKRLLKHNMLLIRGMGGTGKSTLLDHLAEWWEKTDFVKGSFYFGYDKTAYSLEQILREIAGKIYDKREFAIFQTKKLIAQKGSIVDELRAGNYCLILDNCESITGQQLAIPNTLPPDEQDTLKGFLGELRDGNSYIVFGSRGDEDWIADNTFKDNIYILWGLDNEARTDLAKRILDKNSIPVPTAYDDFKRLMVLLAGHPLALEVILPNLKKEDSAKIIEALKMADVDIDSPDVEDKTKSIVRCVEYSFSNLSDEAQKLFICLAPFSGVINIAFLGQYIEELEKFETFKDYPFDQWEAVIKEAVKWGLMNPHPSGMSLMTLQPVFPYFMNLKMRETLDDTGREYLELAFMNHYNGISYTINQLFESKEAKKKQLAQPIAELEYENLYSCLEICLRYQKSILYPFFCLSSYIDAVQDHKKGLLLGEMVLAKFKNYSNDILKGRTGAELAGVVDNIGALLLSIKQPKKAREAYKEALAIQNRLEVFDYKTKRKLSASIYHQLGTVAYELREFDEARSNYQKALEIKIEIKDRYSQASTYHQLGIIAQELREFEEARSNYRRALEIKIEFEDRYSQAPTYHQLGMVAEDLREFEEARSNYQKALEICIAFKDSYNQAKIYHQLGGVAKDMQKLDEARSNYLKALEIKIEFKDRYSQASSYHGLGVVAYELREFDEARSNYQKALEIKIEFKDRYLQASTYHGLGAVALELREFDEARSIYQKALEIYIEFKDRYSQASTYHGLGAVALELREFDETRANYQKALEIYIEFNDRYGQAVNYYQLGLVAQELGEFKEAYANYEKALEIWVEFKDEHHTNFARKRLKELDENKDV